MSPLIKGLNLRESTCLAPVPAAYVLMYFIHPVLGVAPFLYFAYACVFLLLPSIYLGKLTLISDLGLSERAFLGFPITVATLFLAAWGGSRIGLGWHGALILPALALMSLVDIWRRRSPLNASDAVVIKWTAIFLTISLIICFRYFIQTAIPGEGTSVPLFGDDAFMTVMTFSVIKAMQVGTPMMEGMLGDIPFSYHILMHVNNAVAHLITGIHPLYLQVYLYPVFHWFMLAGGVLAGARRFACFTEKQSILAGCLLLYTSGFVFESHSWAQMYGYFHTYFFGLPSTIILGMLIIGYLSDKLTDLPVIYATLLFLAVSSAKGVPLLLIPLSLLPIFTYRLFKRTLTKRDIFFALGCCIVAVLLKIIEYGGTGQIILRKFNLFNSIIPTTLTFLDVSPFFLVLLMIYGFNKVYSFRIARASQYIAFVATMYIISITITRLIDFIGGHQYFFWYFRVFFFILCAYAFQIALDSYSRFLRFAALSAILIAIGLFSYFQYSQYDISARTKEESALTPGEWDALMWAYKNLDHRSRMVSNGAFGHWIHNGHKVSIGPLDSLAVTGLYGYAWPYSWLPNDARSEADIRLKKINSFFDAVTVEARESILSDMPTDYVILCKSRDRASGFALSKNHPIVFSNTAIDIYSIAR